jgi:hypothetical protein
MTISRKWLLFLVIASLVMVLSPRAALACPS